jgi:hypothetical protein
MQRTDGNRPAAGIPTDIRARRGARPNAAHQRTRTGRAVEPRRSGVLPLMCRIGSQSQCEFRTPNEHRSADRAISVAIMQRNGTFSYQMHSLCGTDCSVLYDSWRHSSRSLNKEQRIKSTACSIRTALQNEGPPCSALPVFPDSNPVESLLSSCCSLCSPVVRGPRPQVP